MPRGAARLCEVALWAAPGIVLALLPKCPACVAAWIAVLSGIGITFSVAAGIRSLLIAVSLLMLAGLAMRQAARLVRHRMSR